MIFTQSGMRTDASQAVQIFATALPVLEGFMSLPPPYTFLNVCYGFAIGNSGGNAVIDVEDRGATKAG